MRIDLDDPSLLIEKALAGGIRQSADRTIAVHNPANGVLVGTVPALGRGETRAAIEAAAEAQLAWWQRPAPERCDILETWHNAILANIADLARIMTAEQGKPIAEAEGEIRYAAGFVRWYAAEARRTGATGVPAPTADRRILVMKEPVGVAAAITPWNFPAAMVTRKVAPALAAGCAIVLKPSELTPFTALALAMLAERSGLPAGLFSVLTGDAQAIGGEMTSSHIVRKLSFTGSTAVGITLMRQCADTVKRLSLELGGNAPFIVFDDADVDLAVEGAMAAKFRNAGQTCVCANRILVQGGIHDRFVDRMAERIGAMRIGDGASPGITTGPLINRAATDKVALHLADALAKGASVIAAAGGDFDETRFSRPTLLAGATTAMRFAQEETFGPLAPVFRFDDEAEALAIANGTPFGLAAYFYTENVRRAWRVGEALQFGMVGLNTGGVSIEAAPFGGIKQSGIGREGGAAGLDEYLEIKAFHIGGLA